MIPVELLEDIEYLRKEGYKIDTQEADGRVYLIFRDFAFGPAYRPSSGDLMLFTSIQYPNAGFDMFWVVENLTLVSGGLPQSGDQVETYLGRRWRRFSWHLNRPWNPSHDSLITWLCIVEERLQRGI